MVDVSTDPHPVILSRDDAIDVDFCHTPRKELKIALNGHVAGQRSCAFIPTMQESTAPKFPRVVVPPRPFQYGD